MVYEETKGVYEFSHASYAGDVSHLESHLVRLHKILVAVDVITVQSNASVQQPMDSAD